jgi:hypothetical protein
MGMIDDLKEGSYTEIKRRAEDREINGGHGCQGPAVSERTNDDDDVPHNKITISFLQFTTFYSTDIPNVLE